MKFPSFFVWFLNEHIQCCCQEDANEINGINGCPAMSLPVHELYSCDLVVWWVLDLKNNKYNLFAKLIMDYNPLLLMAFY